MPATDATSIARSCLEAWTTGDFAKTRSLLADDVTFVGPLAATEGVDEYMRGIEGMAKIVEGVEVVQVIADGDDACIIYDLITSTPPATLPTAGWYHVRDGKITSVRAYFDARPLAPSNSER
jgi:ketosteroid isomerase-like protein